MQKKFFFPHFENLTFTESYRSNRFLPREVFGLVIRQLYVIKFCNYEREKNLINYF